MASPQLVLFLPHAVKQVEVKISFCRTTRGGGSRTCLFCICIMSGIKLYGVSDGPPSLACRQALKALGVDFTLVPVNFNIGEHLTPEYEKVSDLFQQLIV